MRRRTLLKLTAAAAALPALGPAPGARAAEGDAFTREVFDYAYPMVKNYLTLYQYALEPGGKQYKGPLNTLNSVARVYTPDDTAIITPNSDTPYSFIVFDLRAEPVVITLPEIEADRYYSMQLVDLYTHNVDYLGTRVDGNGGGDFLIAGPGRQGPVPAGIKRVVTLPTELGLGLIRTQLLDAGDLDRVKAIQAGYGARTLSAYAGTAVPAPVPTVDWPAIDDATLVADFWPLTAFLLRFAPPLPWEGELRGRFGALGLEAGEPWPGAGLPAATAAAMRAMAPPEEERLRTLSHALTDSSTLFGTPEFMKGRYEDRAVAALGGIYGNDAQEALYLIYAADKDGQRLDGASARYRLTFPKDGLPPVDAFWSITMYDLASQLLVANPIDRYLINSAMLKDLKANADGGVSIYLQHESPGPEKEANWLPTPAAPFYAVARLYLPKAEALDGRWKQPRIETLP